ncbi:hypothetical protein FNH05_29500 [Amycolatopsis rhizosphaerae]|uniref:DUF5666 domain-containing protein n=1 Tax=Amycolatopsis rhizosphaerae TaxID=2053003 RepID=A0A558B0T0_9PSEU|nr:hypothetical protein [Amycolatopsis rhizosphaerae]TVT30128.1 hypothetical protein FNH05_29500 [Amycolatopsis rhizosphaerae]
MTTGRLPTTPSPSDDRGQAHWTYTIDGNTAAGNNANSSSIATGDTVTVVATVNGGTATATRVTERTAGQNQQNQQRQG